MKVSRQDAKSIVYYVLYLMQSNASSASDIIRSTIGRSGKDISLDNIANVVDAGSDVNRILDTAIDGLNFALNKPAYTQSAAETAMRLVSGKTIEENRTTKISMIKELRSKHPGILLAEAKSMIESAVYAQANGTTIVNPVAFDPFDL